MGIYKKYWWKILCIILLYYTVIGGLLFDVPRIPILHETIRNQFFHVPMWFAMIILVTVSMVYSIRFLKNSKPINDTFASEFAYAGILFGVLGLFTGMVWARFTWGAWWVNDPKLNSAAIALLIYLAYLVLRGSVEDSLQKAKISAVYNIFAYSALIPLLFILPRLTDSLHPGQGGNPGFNIYDLDSKLRMVFYPAVLAWTILGIWMASLRTRIKILNQRINDQN